MKKARFALRKRHRFGVGQRLLKKTNCNSLIMKLGPNGFIVYKGDGANNVTTQAFHRYLLAL